MIPWSRRACPLSIVQSFGAWAAGRVKRLFSYCGRRRRILSGSGAVSRLAQSAAPPLACAPPCRA
eukprot:scaffold5819_cov115-Isochrysis_galbana.AAC.2